MDRVQKISARLDKIEEQLAINNSPYIPIHKEVVHSHDKPVLAAAIVFAAFVGLFALGWIFGWGWGWETAIGIVGVFAPICIVEQV